MSRIAAGSVKGTKHYSRWRLHGDPLQLGSRATREPNLPVVETRHVSGRLVHFTSAGDSFVWTRRVRAEGQSATRRYGKVFTCEQCHKEVFCASSGRNRYRFCSHDCAGPAVSRAKLGKPRSRSSKAPTRKQQVDALDRLFSALVRAVGKCEICDAASPLQCAHGFSRRYRSVRWDFRNAFCLCARHHMFYTHHPLEWDEWLRERWGLALYEEVRALALQIEVKVDYEAVRDRLVAKTIRRGVTRNRLPKSVKGWTGVLLEESGS